MLQAPPRDFISTRVLVVALVLALVFFNVIGRLT